MQLTIVLAQGTDDDLVIPLDDISPTQTILSLKSLIEPIFNIPHSTQELICNNRRLQDDGATLEAAGITDGDMVSVLPRRAAPPTAASTASRPAQHQANTSTNQGPGAEAETIRLQALGNPEVMGQIRNSQPELAAVVNDPQAFARIWTGLRRSHESAQEAQRRRLARLEADPFDVEAQREIEEEIRQEQVQKNLDFAMEYAPESFGRVHMLYVPVEINGVPIKAFVDSGAQATIMSPSCAERCNVMRLIDKRFAGVARGIGTAAILGRVHAAQMKIGQYWLSASFTVLEGKEVDLLLGLDMLKRYQGCIDLKDNVLRIMDAVVPFLSENELPDSAKEINEPTVEGPGGVKIGADTGAVITPEDNAANTTAGKTAQSAARPSTAAASAARSHWGQPSATTGTAAQSIQPTQTGPQSQPQPVSRENVETLMNMGFSENEAKNALESTGGNIELAAAILYGGD